MGSKNSNVISESFWTLERRRQVKEKDDRGFTLVEMCLVIILIGIICVATVPATAIVRRQEAKKMALEFCYDLDLMRQQSMANGIANTLTLEPAASAVKSSYKISQSLIKADNEKRTDALENVQTLEITMEGQDQAGSTIEASLDTITFKGNKATKATDGTGEVISKLVVKVKNKEQVVKLEYDTLTGNYEVSIL